MKYIYETNGVIRVDLYGNLIGTPIIKAEFEPTKEITAETVREVNNFLKELQKVFPTFEYRIC